MIEKWISETSSAMSGMENIMEGKEILKSSLRKLLEDNFCDGAPTDFNENTIENLKNYHEKINKLVDWVNS